MKILFIMLFLTGCASNPVPVTMNFPQAPEPLLVKPEELEPLPEGTKDLSDLLENSTTNFGKYRELKLKYEQWQNWYNANRLIHKETTGK